MFIDQAGVAIADGSHVANGRGYGPVGEALGGIRFEPGLRRPYIETDRGSRYFGQKVVTVNTGRTRWDPQTQTETPIFRRFNLQQAERAFGVNMSFAANATTLQKEAWIEIDRAVMRTPRQRLRAWADLVAANPRGGFNAMAKLTLEYQTMNDVGEAVVDMDVLSEGRSDRPLLNLKSIPLPVTHSDFWFSSREIAVSRNTTTPLDTTMAEMAGRRVSEMIEKTLIGTETGMTYGTRSGDSLTAHTGTSTVYGYTNFPYRVTKTNLHTPIGSNPQEILSDVLSMVETMQSNGFFGPYTLYHSTPYSQYLKDDYFRAGSTSAVRSVRERLMEDDDLTSIRRLDFLTSGFQLILVQMDPMVCQAINGMDISTIQWDLKGGLETHFKVLAIQVPLLKSTYGGISGIIHATTS